MSPSSFSCLHQFHFVSLGFKVYSGRCSFSISPQRAQIMMTWNTFEIQFQLKQLVETNWTGVFWECLHYMLSTSPRMSPPFLVIILTYRISIYQTIHTFSTNICNSRNWSTEEEIKFTMMIEWKQKSQIEFLTREIRYFKSSAWMNGAELNCWNIPGMFSLFTHYNKFYIVRVLAIIFLASCV